MQRTCKIRLLNEVHMMVVGLHGDHLMALYEKYGVFQDNYFFNPKYKLGRWDGKIRYFQKSGQTFIYLIEEILPQLIKMGYKVTIDDVRQSVVSSPSMVDADIFSRFLHPDTGKPIILREDQVRGVNSLLEHGNGVCIAGTGAGKAQSLSAKIMTPRGWKQMGEMAVGDTVITPSGRVANVTGVFPQGSKPMFKITFHDGASTTACAEHLWSANVPIKGHTAKTQNRTIQTSDISSFLERKKTGIHTPGNISIPVCQPVYKQKQLLPIDPYVMGALLGDGSFTTGTVLFSNTDSHIIDRVSNYVTSLGLSLKFNDATVCDYRISKVHPQDTFPPLPNILTEKLMALGLYKHTSDIKFIPAIYKGGSIEQRWELLRGLMDTDGTADKRGNVSFTSTSYQLAKDVQTVAWSLGCTCTITSRTPTYTYKEELHEGRIAYTCHMRHLNPTNFFYTPTKKARCRDLHANGRIMLTRRVTSVEYIGDMLAQCIMIDDPDHLYITDDYIVTHNTFMCAALVTAYNNENIKTLTIVPDGTLIRQTKRDYNLVELDTGEYSGKEKSLDHKHVVSTWQALKNNPSVVLMFDMIIVDEAQGLRGNVLTNILTDHAARIPYRFGFTGTLPESPTDKMSVHVAVGPVRHVMPAHELIDLGVLAELDIDIMQLKEDLSSQYKKYCDEECIGNPPTYAEFKDGYFPDYTSEKNYLQSNTDRLQWIADMVMTKRDAKKGNVLCLVSSIAVARKLHKMIPGSHVVNGTDVANIDDRQEIYDLFKGEDNLVVIATVHVAGTGLSINRIFNLVLIDIGKSFIRVIQAIGRGLRKAHDKNFVQVTDVCSDLKYAKQHLTKRARHYKEAKYPHKKHVIDYTAV